MKQKKTNTIKVRKVKALYLDTNEVIGTYNSASDAGRVHNIDKSQISKVCKNKRISAGKINNRQIKWEFVIQ